MSEFAIKPPDMSRNMALAGKTVSSRGMNITYDELGYAVKAVNYGSKVFEGTVRSVRAPSKEAVLADAGRAADTGLTQDLEYFSDRELAHASDLRQQVAEGTLSENKANEYLNEIRKMYGYSGGSSGHEYTRLSYPEQREQPVVAAEERAQSIQSSGAEQLRDSYQEQLKQQQQIQSLQSELNDLRTDALLRSYGEQKKNELFDVLFEDEDDK